MENQRNYITFFHEGAFMMQNFEKLPVPELMRVCRNFKAIHAVFNAYPINEKVILDQIWNYLPEDTKELINHDVITIGFVILGERTPCITFRYQMGVSLPPENYEKFDFYYCKAIELLNYETREKMMKSVAFELTQAIEQWGYNMHNKYEKAE